MNLTDASNFEIFSATIDEEYSAAEIAKAAAELGIAEDAVLQSSAQRKIADWLEDNHDNLVAARGVKP